MAYWGFYGGSGDEEMDIQSHMRDPSSVSLSEIFNTTRTQSDNQHYGQRQPAGTRSGVLNDQPIEPPSSDPIPNIHDQRPGTPEKIRKKRAADRKSRKKKKEEEKQMKMDLDRIKAQNVELNNENVLMRENLQFQANEICRLQNDHEKLKNENDKRNAAQQRVSELLEEKVQMKDDLDKIKAENMKLRDENVSMREKLQSQANEIHKLKIDLKKLKDETDKQNDVEQTVSELLKNKGIDLDGDDSGEENDDCKKNKKRAANSAPSGRCFGKVPKFANKDELMETVVVKKECYDAGASNPTAMVSDPYSIPECIRILNSMEGIPFHVAKKAFKKFQSSDTERQTFVELKEEWRSEWVKEP